MKAKKLLTGVLIGVLTLGLVACGQKGGGNEEKKSAGDDKTIVVGATPNPHAEILQEAVKPLLEKEGYKLDVKIFNDYVLPNEGLNEGSLDANYFQHIPYLEETVKAKGYKLTYTSKVHIEPMAIYSEKIKDIKDVKDGATVTIPNDPTNGARAIKLLEKAGLIKAKDVELPTVNDITENSKNLNIKEMDAPQLPTTLKDVDLSVINSNFALEAKLNPLKDSLFIEDKDSPYANIIAVREDNKDTDKIKALSKAVNSPEVKKYIEEKYKGAIIPTF